MQRNHYTDLKQASQEQLENSDSLLNSAVSSRQLEIRLSPRRTLRFLLFVILGLNLVSLIGQWTQYFLPDYFLRDRLAGIFNVDAEKNIPAFYSMSTLLFCSILLATIAYAKKIARNRYVPYWGALSIIFLYLAWDEAFSIHEQIIEPLRSTLNTNSFFHFAWVIPGSILVLLCLLAFWGFLCILPKKTRRLFLVAGTIYVAGALGMEMINGYYVSLYGQQNMGYAILTTLEEFSEMVGIAVFIYALLSYMGLSMDLDLSIRILKDRKQGEEPGRLSNQL
ncbi:hypothetical protein [Allocoleopsis franciscana]|uniref:Uncharacterized protein n=1 Tax=Allocoleopsis franciscana PCC 7113 TaxID=1173027 RepID=K9W9P8_9CYAN|nr:hypothetical protein [Allocoleopsis franciscana]AFZ16499.1 hypothetical protein Mic7113_0583 [Allocoleopsis franciscana PCC 7113]